MSEPIVFQIAVPVPRNWGYLEVLRTSVLNCLSTIFQNHEFCRAVGMVTRELLENALKFGDWTSTRETSFKLSVFGGPESVTIEVSNPMKAGDKSTDKLMGIIAWLNSCPDPKMAYLERLSQVADEAPESDPTSSGLGLVRIAYEGNCTLRAEIVDGSLTIRATTRP